MPPATTPAVIIEDPADILLSRTSTNVRRLDSTASAGVESKSSRGSVSNTPTHDELSSNHDGGGGGTNGEHIPTTTSKSTTPPIYSRRGGLRIKNLRWHNVLPFHVLIFAVAMMLDDGILMCAQDLGSRLQETSDKAENFVSDHPLDFSSPEAFRTTRALWHHDFDSLLQEVDRTYKSVVLHELYDGPCTNIHPLLFFFMDAFALAALLLVAGFFLYQDATTPMGASRSSVFVATNLLLAIFQVLAVLNFPVLNLMSLAVRLSVKLQGCVSQLKALQRSVVTGQYDLDEFNLHANVWDGTSFGVREPIFSTVIDPDFNGWLKRMMFMLFLFMSALGGYLVYRANVKSLLLWRSAIPSVVCIGVVFPDSREPNKLWRLGSGCLVSAHRGLVLTNWHLFQRMGVEPAVTVTSSTSTSTITARPDGWTTPHQPPLRNPATSDPTEPQMFGNSAFMGTSWRGNVGSVTSWADGEGGSFSFPASSSATYGGGRSGMDSPLLLPSTFARTQSEEHALSEFGITDGKALEEPSIFGMGKDIRMDSMRKSLQSLRMGESVMEDDVLTGVVGGGGSGAADVPFPPFSAIRTPSAQSSSMDVGAMSPVKHIKSTTSATGSSTSRTHHHLTSGGRFAEAFRDVFPSMKIYIGTATRGHPKWEFEAEFTSAESPSSEFTPFGLDLLVLRISKKVNFASLETDDGQGDSCSYTYSFDPEKVQTTPIETMDSEQLQKFKLGNPWKLRAGDEKLRLLGFPASGGFTLSVLTGYFTSLSFDYPARHRGAWLNVNIALPHGGSGGAAINSKGELVGVCTQTKGELTNIRSISEARHLIEKAKAEVDAKILEEIEKKKRAAGKNVLVAGGGDGIGMCNQALGSSCDVQHKVSQSVDVMGSVIKRLVTTPGLV